EPAGGRGGGGGLPGSAGGRPPRAPADGVRHGPRALRGGCSSIRCLQLHERQPTGPEPRAARRDFGGRLCCSAFLHLIVQHKLNITRLCICIY
ncbi:unnamed protein product, partial [Heterosigma akashiwo]